MNSATDEHSASVSGGEGDMHLTGPVGWTRSLCSGIRAAVGSRRLADHRDRSNSPPAPSGNGIRTAWLAILASSRECVVRYSLACRMVPRCGPLSIVGGGFFSSFPVLKWLLFLVARQPSESSGRLDEPIAQVMTEPSSLFRQPTPVAEQPGFETENPRQFWMGDREIVSHQISGAVQD